MASTDVVSTVMDQLDVNNNGEISWEEFWSWWQARQYQSPSTSLARTSPDRNSIDQNKIPESGFALAEEEIERPPTHQASRGVTPSPEVQQLRGLAMGRPSAPPCPNAGPLDVPDRMLPSRGSLFSRGSSLGNFSVGPKWCDPPEAEQPRLSVSRGGFRSRTPTANPGPRISFAPPPASSLGFRRPSQSPHIDANVHTAGMLNLAERMHASGRVNTGFRIGGSGPGENPFHSLSLVVPPRRK